MTDEDLVKRRWSVLQLVRFAAAITVVLGILIISGRLIDSEATGYILLVVGAAAFFVLPKMLAKRWKSPDA